jgi:hypothetical protein
MEAQVRNSRKGLLFRCFLARGTSPAQVCSEPDVQTVRS